MKLRNLAQLKEVARTNQTVQILVVGPDGHNAWVQLNSVLWVDPSIRHLAIDELADAMKELAAGGAP